jgi:hypothetical protein
MLIAILSPRLSSASLGCRAVSPLGPTGPGGPCGPGGPGGPAIPLVALKVSNVDSERLLLRIEQGICRATLTASPSPTAG